MQKRLDEPLLTVDGFRYSFPLFMEYGTMGFGNHNSVRGEHDADKTGLA